MKSGVDNKRRERREECLSKALELHKKKKNAEAHKFFIQSVSISKEMVHTYLRLLRSMKIEFYIAPYEADA